jgi:hypothetical protein
MNRVIQQGKGSQKNMENVAKRRMAGRSTVASVVKARNGVNHAYSRFVRQKRGRHIPEILPSRLPPIPESWFRKF